MGSLVAGKLLFFTKASTNSLATKRIINFDEDGDDAAAVCVEA